jgi:hypothetical protein
MDNNLIVDYGSHCVKYGVLGRKKRASDQQLLSMAPSEGYAPDSTYAPPLDPSATLSQLLSIASEAELTPKKYALVLLTEPLLPARTKELILQGCFESLSAAKVLLGWSPVTALYAAGAASGTVVDIGHTATRVVPVAQGSPVVSRTEILHGCGGKKVDEEMARVLRSKEACVTQPILDLPNWTFSELKTKICYAGSVRAREKSEFAVTLPDGTVLECPMSTEECAACGNSLFTNVSPSFALCHVLQDLELETSWPGAQQAAKVWCLVGGATIMNGFNDRFAHEMSRLPPPYRERSGDAASPGNTPSVKRLPVEDPQGAAWLGGCILSSMSIFSTLCIDQQMYDECGPRGCLRFSFMDGHHMK